jgi:hypothetical protein
VVYDRWAHLNHERLKLTRELRELAEERDALNQGQLIFPLIQCLTKEEHDEAPSEREGRRGPVEVDRASLYRLSQISRQIELMRERHRSLEAQAREFPAKPLM